MIQGYPFPRLPASTLEQLITTTIRRTHQHDVAPSSTHHPQLRAHHYYPLASVTNLTGAVLIHPPPQIRVLHHHRHRARITNVMQVNYLPAMCRLWSG